LDGRCTNLDEHEDVVDNLYIKANNAFDVPLDPKIGRQDFLMGEDLYGEGLLISKGTPQDGSRTFYFKAAKAKWKVDKGNSVDFVYIPNQWQDQYLPTWRSHIANGFTSYDSRKYLDTSDSQAFLVYGRAKPIHNLVFEPYYIWKREEKGRFPREE